MKNKEEQTAPKLRFKGYTDAWQQRKFSDLYKKSTEKNDLSFKTNQVISVATMSWKNIPENSSPEYMKTYNVMRKGDIAFEGHKSKDYEFGRFVENTLGNGIVSHIFDVYRPLHLNNSTLPFWKYYIHSEKSMRNILRKSTTSATMMRNLVKKDLYKQYLLVPSMMEQDKIGTLLSKLDETISLLQKKLMLLNKVYTGLVHILKNKKIAHSSKKVSYTTIVIGQAFEVTRGKVLSKNNVNNAKTSETPYPVYSSQTQNNGLLGYYKNFLFKDAITWTTDGANAGTVSYRSGKFYSTNVNGVLLPKKEIPDKVIAELLNQVTGKYVARIGNPKLMNNIMSEIKVTIPDSSFRKYYSTILEQNDNLLIKLGKRINLLHQFKKFLLQNMFI